MTSPGPRFQASRDTGTSSAIRNSISSERPHRGHAIDTTGNHYCMAVDDLDGAIVELESRGIDYVRAVQGEGTVQIWIADPAGNTIELQQETGRP